MSLGIGIVGLPNVGKSTLFNALLKKSPFAEATEGQAGRAKIGNYPFTTIEPNVGVVEVPDERLPILAKIVKTEKIVPAIVEFYDIAGLVKDASKGEGLGNKFLSHIREVAAIVHVVRLFEDSNVVHVSEKIDPDSDIKTIDTELMLADLQTLENQKEPKGAASKEDKRTYELIQKIKVSLNKGIPVRDIQFDKEEAQLIKRLNLLTIKPVIYVFNVSESQLESIKDTERQVKSVISQSQLKSGDTYDSNYIILNAKLENDVLALSEEEQKEYLRQYHLADTGLNRLIKKSYEILGLLSFLTAGEKEVRAWTVQKGTLAPQAAGVIHTDFEKHFIKAEIADYQDFVDLGGWNKVKEAGKANIVGTDYQMKDGDIVDFKVGI